jgi:hypothetical protein
MDTLAVLKQQPDDDWCQFYLRSEDGKHCATGWILRSLGVSERELRILALDSGRSFRRKAEELGLDTLLVSQIMGINDSCATHPEFIAKMEAILG